MATERLPRGLVRYRTMRCSIPEGGEVVLYVPEHIGGESLEMAAECIALQMRIFKRHASQTDSPQEAGDA